MNIQKFGSGWLPINIRREFATPEAVFEAAGYAIARVVPWDVGTVRYESAETYRGPDSPKGDQPALTVTVRETTRQAIERACSTLENDSPDGERRDYSLAEVAAAVGGMADVSWDRIVRGDEVVEMDGSTWCEMGHQYSVRKLWWPK